MTGCAPWFWALPSPLLLPLPSLSSLLVLPVVGLVGWCTASLAAFAVAGMQEQRRTTSTDAPRTHRVRFFAGRTVLELVGPSPANNDHKGARFTGLGLVSDDLDRTAEVLGERLSAPTDSAHEGRRVATLRPEGNDISVPISILSPHPTAGIEHIAAEARESQGIEL